jgi:hypothetical protein
MAEMPREVETFRTGIEMKRRETGGNGGGGPLPALDARGGTAMCFLSHQIRQFLRLVEKYDLKLEE